MQERSLSRALMRWCRLIHRHLSFFFAGVVIVYALSGILMNHRSQINPHYSAERIVVEDALPKSLRPAKKDLLPLLERIGEKGNYTKHYFPGDSTVKVFLKGGSTLEVNLKTGKGVYDKLRKRPLLSDFVRLHYNPGRWWTYFSDLFALALIAIAITGLFLVKGRKGLKGTGGLELIAGIAVPLLFLLL